MKLESVDFLYVCPGCNYIVSETHNAFVIHDHKCPRCKKYRLSEFNKKRPPFKKFEFRGW